MSQLSIEFSEKLDVPLAELCNGQGLHDSARIPVVIRCHNNAVHEVAELAVELGGSLRHQIGYLSMVAAWVPLVSLNALAADPRVRSIGLEQEFVIA